MMSYIAPYITDEEYRCHCCGTLPPDIVIHRAIYDILFGKFKDIREAWGMPIDISSGYRCLKNNLQEGGKVLSGHLFGLALDLNMPSAGKVEELDELIELLHPDLRRGTYKNSMTFIHIDAAWLIVPRPTADYEKGVRWNDGP